MPYVRVVGEENTEARMKMEKFATRARNFARRVAHFSPIGYLARTEYRRPLEEKIAAINEEAKVLNAELGTVEIINLTTLHDIATTPHICTSLFNDTYFKLKDLKNSIVKHSKDFENLYLQTRSLTALLANEGYFIVEAALTESRDAYRDVSGKTPTPVLDNALTVFQ